jgi:hypothetical protein
VTVLIAIGGQGYSIGDAIRTLRDGLQKMAKQTLQVV